jgi:glycerophosphoryl diester phosphodiesterase
LFPEIEEMLTEKGYQQTFLYETKSPDYRDQHMRANEWEGIRKELKIKRYVSSRDVRIVCPQL